MWKHIERIRRANDKDKVRLSLIISGCITLVIAVIWIFSFVHSVSSKAESTDNSPSIFGSTIEEFKRAFKNNPFSGQPTTAPTSQTESQPASDSLIDTGVTQ